MRKIDWRDVGKRAGKTFVQAFVASISVSAEQIVAIRDIESAKVIFGPIIIGGIAAGVSAVWNLLTGYFSKNMEG